MSNEIYSSDIYYDAKKDTLVKLTINEFYGVEYLHIRKYFRDFHGEWAPSKEGVSMPLDFENSRALLEALIAILSLAESREIIEEQFGEILRQVYI
jgi:hypothetical protein